MSCRKTVQFSLTIVLLGKQEGRTDVIICFNTGERKQQDAWASGAAPEPGSSIRKEWQNLCFLFSLSYPSVTHWAIRHLFLCMPGPLGLYAVVMWLCVQLIPLLCTMQGPLGSLGLQAQVRSPRNMIGIPSWVSGVLLFLSHQGSASPQSSHLAALMSRTDSLSVRQRSADFESS